MNIVWMQICALIWSKVVYLGFQGSTTGIKNKTVSFLTLRSVYWNHLVSAYVVQPHNVLIMIHANHKMLAGLTYVTLNKGGTSDSVACKPPACHNLSHSGWHANAQLVWWWSPIAGHIYCGSVCLCVSVCVCFSFSARLSKTLVTLWACRLCFLLILWSRLWAGSRCFTTGFSPMF